MFVKLFFIFLWFHIIYVARKEYLMHGIIYFYTEQKQKLPQIPSL